MSSQEKRQNPYEIELPQSIIDSFARFLVPEIQKLYASEEGRKELEAWKKKYSDKSEEWSKILRSYAKGRPISGRPFANNSVRSTDYALFRRVKPSAMAILCTALVLISCRSAISA